MEQITFNPNNEPYYSDDFIKGFKCGAERQFEADKADRLQREWIPCSERLPKRNENYLVTFHNKWPDREYKTVEIEKFRNGGFDENLYMKVIAWMPLPEPWKGVDDETD